MAEGEFDHLIVGSTPLAGLLASRLASAYGKRVCLVGTSFSPFRLERGASLSVDVITRPDTLALLKRATEETLKHLVTLGKNLADRVDPLFVAETADSMAAVAHFRHLAQALGFAIEQIGDTSIAEGALFRVRGAYSISVSRLGPALDAAFERHGVTVLDRSETAMTLRRDGSARIVVRGAELAAAQTILADDEAIVTEIAADTWDKNLVAEPRLAMLVEAARPVGESFAFYLDRGLVLRGDGNSLSAVLSGDMATAEARLAASARKALPLRRAGEARFTGIRTLDAAPVLGQGRGHKAMQVAGFGVWGAFFAPVIARLIAGVPSPDEEAWFAARRATQRSASVDYASVPA